MAPRTGRPALLLTTLGVPDQPARDALIMAGAIGVRPCFLTVSRAAIAPCAKLSKSKA
jgi:hypothetical protein